MGVEQFVYEEHVPDQNIDSYAKTFNVVMGIEFQHRWDSFFLGSKGVVPALSLSDEETWMTNGTVDQTNRLTYGWTRADGYAGLPLSDNLDLYGGIRLSVGVQNRNDFVLSGESVPGSAEEIIQSVSLLMGVSGEGEFSTRWKWNCRVEYFVPIAVELTNSYLPGFVVRDHNGYTAELKLGTVFSLTDRLFLNAQLYKGIMHWDGSDWYEYNGGYAKWPENDTNYFGGMVSITERF